MHKLYLVLIVLLFLTLVAAATGPVIHADNPARSPHGRFYRLPLKNRPDISDLASSTLSESDNWLVKPRYIRRLSEASREYLLRRYSPLLRTLDSGPAYIKRAEVVASNENIRVNNPALDGQDRSQYETTAAAFGNNLVVSFYDSAGLNSRNPCGLSVSNDGGATWKQSRIPTYKKGSNVGSGVVTVDNGGNFYYSTVAIDKDDRVTIGVSRSTDGGKRWGKLEDGSTTAGKKGDFQDKGWIAADRSPSSRFKDRVYLSWTDFLKNGKTQIMFARSLKRGRKFMAPQFIAETTKQDGFVQGSMVITGPDGEIYILWIDAEFGKTDIKITRSTDGGSTFSDAATLASIRNPALPANGIFDVPLPLPSLGVDLSQGQSRGYVYVTYPVRGEGSDRADVILLRSTDGGATWSEPRKLNDDKSTAEQLLPSVAVAEDGAVAVSWYDRRNDLANLSLLDIYAAVSTDGGNSFAPNRRITNANWPLVPTPPGLRGGYHGNYYQLATRGKQFFFNWADDRSGTDSDIYIAFKTGQELARPEPDFILSARTSSQALKPGGSADFLIETRAVDGATGPLALEATPSIKGLSFDFSNQTIETGASVNLTVRVAPDLLPGPYLIGVTARRGDQTRTTYTRLTVLDIDPLVKLPQNITNDPSNSLSPASTIDKNGNVSLAFLGDSSGIFSIFFSRSNDGGNTFSAPMMLPRNPGTFIGSPLVAATESEIYIAYLELFEQPEFVFKTMFTRSTDGGKTFSEAQPIITDPKIFVVPESLQLDGDGTIHFASTALQPLDRSNPVFTNFDARSTDGGRTFIFNKIFESRSPVSQPIVDVEGDGRTVRALFIDFDRQNGALLLARSSDGGETFAPPARVPTTLDSLLFAGAFFGPNNRTHVIYAEGDISKEDFRLFHTRLDENGQAVTPVKINGDALTVLSIGLAADASGNVVVAFEGSLNKIFDTNYVSQVFYCNSIDGGTTFSSTKNFKPARGGDFSPVVLLDRSGQYSIIWNGFSRDAADIFYSVSSDKGRTFAPAVNLTNNSGVSSYSDFAFDPEGRFQLLWQDNTPGSFDVFRIKLGN